jgi:hypothetical protein
MKLLRALSNGCYRISSVATAIAATLIYGWFIATVMPQQSADSQVYAGDWGAPDRHLFYTPDELYGEISNWDQDGRSDYISFRLGLDILWALAYTSFLVGWISVALRYSFASGDPRRLLNTFPFITLVCDYSENALGILLVANADNRLDMFAWIAASTTSVKWISLVLAHIVLVYAMGSALVARLRK